MRLKQFEALATAIGLEQLRHRRLPVIARMLVACLALALAPVIIAWSMGIYDRVEVKRHERALIQNTQLALQNIAKDGLGDFSEEATLSSFAKRNKVYVRVLDEAGRVVGTSSAALGEGRMSRRRWFTEVADFFFGPGGPPKLSAFDEARKKVPEREEVLAALRGAEPNVFLAPDTTKMFVFYRTVRIPDTEPPRFLYLTRMSRRSVRSLYDFRYQLLKLTLALLAGGMFMGIWMGWSVVGPLNVLSDRIRRYMETGTRTRLALKRQDEIGQLSRDFDAMAQRMEARLERTARIAADFAHDLKNPIAAVGASAELLEGEAELSAKRRARLANAMSEAAEHMRLSVDAMLQLARLDERLPTEPKAELSLASLVRAACTRYEDLDISIRVQCADEGVLLGIESRLLELVRNLIDNALVFAKTEVLVEVNEVQGGVLLRVSDDGPGVSKGNREKIFGRFFSVRPSGKPSGSGLGLAIVQTIAEAHGGEVQLLSKGPLPGASFEVRLRAPL